ncbi:zinc-containing alcohol dehydrogenase superfamily [Weissella koreensis KCTC 3621]|uniref:zinc-binding dehydrogenase n=1 Tax=Weissella koreensis TaxID=165096 RepID=UPI00026F2A8A|nr:zinc-binding dehydrogenase [Weissella koreensis]EJF33548.1 zinc-containing alcohol dehydrogenase superfamily [Weissella koreensis KCTC 3621]
MKAIVVNQPGGPENLFYQDVPKPKTVPGWSLIKIKGFGINHSEIFTREGKSPSVNFPRILGIECVGVIEETTDPNRLPNQQKVISIMGEMGRAFDGSYAEYVLVPNEQIYPVNTELAWGELAAIPETYYTAYGSMLNLNITESDELLVRGATSGVGIAFLNLIKSKYPSIKVTGTTRNLDKSANLKKVGFDHIIEEKNGVIQGDNSFDKILELIGPATIKDSFNHLNEKGIVCSTGQLGGQWDLNNFDPIMDIHQNSYLTSFYSNNVDEHKLNDLLNYITRNKVNVKPEKIFNLSDLSKAHSYLQSSQSFGKVIVLTEQ